MPIGPPGLNQNQPPQGPRGPSGPQAGKDDKSGQAQQPKVAEADGVPAKPQSKNGAKASGATPTPAGAKQAPPPPVDSKPDVSAALAPPQTQNTQQPASGKGAPGGPKGGRIIPAVPIPSPRANKTAPHSHQQAAAAVATAQVPSGAHQQNATQLATAAVAEAMAKLNLQNKGQVQSQPQGQAPASDPMNNLAQKVEGMRDQNRQHAPRQRGTGEFRGRGGRGGRGGLHSQHPKMEVPTTDFDFESANAKFNKQDLIKEAIASGSPLGEGAPTTADASADKEEVVIPSGSMYDKSSFFDRGRSSHAWPGVPQSRTPEEHGNFRSGQC